MTHVEDSTLLAFLDGEVEAPRKEVAEHLVACPQCAAELQTLRDMTADFRTAVGLVDVAPPVAAARARLEQARRDAARREPRRVGFGPFRVGLAQAAVLALLLAGVAGAAIPGSPLRLWIESALGGGERADPAPAVVEPASPDVAPVPGPVEPAEAAASEMRIEPVDGRVRIVLRRPPADARVIVRLTDGTRAELQATASFISGAGRLEASAIAGDEIVVTIPRSIGSAIVEVDGRMLVHRENGEFSYLPTGATSRGEDIVIRLNR